jgi:nicotinate-nucleotide adenylyltransferase
VGEQTAAVIEPEVLLKAVQSGNRKKIGILGGTFNPPHMGHLIIADQVCNQLDLEKIWFLPSAKPPHSSGKKTIDAKHRVNMVKRAIRGNDTFELQLAEVNRGGKSYTFDTIKELTEDYPEIDFYFIIGGDMVEDLPNWHKVDELVKMVQFVAVNRPSYAKESPYPVIWVDVPDIAISSTEIRQKIADHCSVNYLLPEKVLEYIEEKGLYKDDETNTANV